jgi:putative transposase
MTRPQRQSIRLRQYDYRLGGLYFVTLCVQHKHCLFGEIVDSGMVLNGLGEVVAACWVNLTDHFPQVSLDAFIVMPNHMHGIIEIKNETVGAQHAAPALEDNTTNSTTIQINRVIQATQAREVPLFHQDVPQLGQEASPPPGHTNVVAGSLGAIVRSFKSAATKRINEARGTPAEAVWQRNYFDRIIRNDQALRTIRAYINQNPLAWDTDPEKPYKDK